MKHYDKRIMKYCINKGVLLDEQSLSFLSKYFSYDKAIMLLDKLFFKKIITFNELLGRIKGGQS